MTGAVRDGMRKRRATYVISEFEWTLIRPGHWLWSAVANGRVRLALLEIDNVGHAWPAGVKTEKIYLGGDWIATDGLNYPAYITDWLIRHNLRAGGHR